MSKVHEILDVAEDTWRDVVKTEWPLFADTKVIKAEEDPKSNRHWMFYTDGNVIHMDVQKPQVVEDMFTKVIAKMYENAYGQPQEVNEELIHRLIHDTLTYLCFHEQFHPTFCPDSKDDEATFDKALYEGIKKAEPRLSKVQILNKVGNVRNAGWDQVIDDAFFYMANYGNKIETRLEDVLENAPIDLEAITHLPDGVIPIFDIIELEVHKEKFQSMFYPLSRSIYSLLFVKDAEMREITFDYFKNRTTKQMREQEFDQVIKAALKGLVSELTPEQLRFARIDKKEFEDNIETVYDNYNDQATDPVHEQLIGDVTALLWDKRTRYDSTKGFIQPLSKYISLAKEEKRAGTHIGQGQGSGSGQPQPGDGDGQGQGQSDSNGDDQTSSNNPGGNTEAALLNLADLLDENEANELLSEVANSSNSGGRGAGAAKKQKRLAKLASDQFYKRNAKEIDIRSPSYEASSIELGTRLDWIEVGRQNLRAQEVATLDLVAIANFTADTGLDKLVKLSDHEFQLIHYEEQETQETDYSYEPTGVDLPDNVVFHVDSSGSMGPENYVDSGSRYDTLMHVCYGILKTLKKAANDNKKTVQVMAANFSNGTILSKPAELNHMYNTPNNEAKQVLTGFQGGGTEYAPDTFKKIQKQLKPGKTVHIWITDGDLWDPNKTYREVEKLVQNPDTSFLYFEVDSYGSTFGNSLSNLERQCDNVKCYQNVNIKDVQNSALEVLIQYNSKHTYEQLI